MAIFEADFESHVENCARCQAVEHGEKEFAGLSPAEKLDLQDACFQDACEDAWDDYQNRLVDEARDAELF